MTLTILDQRALSVSKPRYQKKADVAMRSLVFELNSQRLAVPVEQVDQVIHEPLVTPLPGTPDFMPGVLNKKGEILCVVNISPWMGAPPSEEVAYVAVVTYKGRKLALAVDRPVEFRDLSAEELREIQTDDDASTAPLFLNVTTDLVAIIDLPTLFQYADIRKANITHRGVRTTMEEIS